MVDWITIPCVALWHVALWHVYCIVTCDTLHCDILSRPIWQRPHCHLVRMILRFWIFPASVSRMVLGPSLDAPFLTFVARRRQRLEFGPLMAECTSSTTGLLNHHLASLLLLLQILVYLERFGNRRILGCGHICRGDSFPWIATLITIFLVLLFSIHKSHSREKLLRLAGVTHHRHHAFAFSIEDV